jgi:hypothetical protein
MQASEPSRESSSTNLRHKVSLPFDELEGKSRVSRIGNRLSSTDGSQDSAPPASVDVAPALEPSLVTIGPGSTTGAEAEQDGHD